MDEKDKLRIDIMRELEIGHQRIFQRPLPPFLTTAKLVALDIRPKSSLDKDNVNRVGLLPLPGGKKGKPRKYALSKILDYLAG